MSIKVKLVDGHIDSFITQLQLLGVWGSDPPGDTALHTPNYPKHGNVVTLGYV